MVALEVGHGQLVASSTGAVRASSDSDRGSQGHCGVGVKLEEERSDLQMVRKPRDRGRLARPGAAKSNCLAPFHSVSGPRQGGCELRCLELSSPEVEVAELSRNGEGTVKESSSGERK